MAKELGWPQFPGFSGGAMDRLLSHDWPGNVRELRNVTERSVARGAADAEIDAVAIDPFASAYALRTMPRPDAAPAPAPKARTEEETAEGGILSDPARPFDLREALQRVEHDLLQQALAAQRYNQRATAKQLGLTYDQLRGRLRKHGLLRAGPEGETP
jgi:psp operon transcriptional activator